MASTLQNQIERKIPHLKVSAQNILIADDSDDDVCLYTRAFARAGCFSIQFVKDGIDVVHYLEGKGLYGDRLAFPFPDMIVLDLKMQRMDGFDVLEWLSKYREYRHIPVVILSASILPSDIQRSYDLGAKSFFEKPASFQSLVAICNTIVDYWGHARRTDPLYATNAN